MRALRQTYPGLDMVYLGDVARVPYGGRSVTTITRYALEDARFLLRKHVSRIIVACNTVSATALPRLQEELEVPVCGVIDCSAARAAQRSRSGVVGVIGTQATVNSGAYRRKLLEYRPGLRVLSQACPLLVPLIENGIRPEDPVAELLCRRYLEPLQGQGMDVLILGCTHYPVYEELLGRLLPGVTLINTGRALAESLEEEFAPWRQGRGNVEYYATERSAAFEELVHAMDGSVDAAGIRVDGSFI